MNVFDGAAARTAATSPISGRLDLVLQFQDWIRRIPLDREAVVIGRSGESDIQVPDTEMSRQHCRLAAAADGSWWVEDLGSRAGTQISGLPIAERTPLAPGTSVEVGATRIWLEEREAPKAGPSVRQAEEPGVQLLLRTI